LLGFTDGVILMSPPSRTKLSLRSPWDATIALLKASRAAMTICLKLGSSSITLSITGIMSDSVSRGLLDRGRESKSAIFLL
jgi:hypothetical protein